ncbi:MAG TPA: hypothetical protein VKA48_12860 [Gammaproteobacteria bacterium]|nr:hypothetical protein [Gammaproteobacteria bacterium]
MTEARDTAGGWFRRSLLGVLGLLLLIRLVGGEGPSGGEGSGPTLPVANQAVTSAQAQDQQPMGRSGQRDLDLNRKEIRVLKELKARKQAMGKNQEKLKKTRERLKILRGKVSKDLDRLKRYRDQIQTGLSKEKDLRSKKMQHLVSVYSNMDPQKAAERVNRMDRPTAVKLLTAMTGKSAGRILSYVDPDKANKISQAMTELVDDVKK